MALSRPTDQPTAERVRAQIQRKRSDTTGTVFKWTLLLALLLSLTILAVLIVDVTTDGWSFLSGDIGAFLQGTLRSRPDDPVLGVHQGLVGSFWIAVMVAALSFPIGIGSAIYLEEYATRNRFTRFIEVNIRNLAGVPSVVYGLLGLYIFVENVGFMSAFTGGRQTALSGGLTIAILVLPIVIITAQEAVRAVPQALKEGAYGVGATRWEVTRTQILPYAAPGILTGTLLSMSRAIGEAAPLIVIGAVSGRLGNDPGFFAFDQLDDAFTAMPIVITTWTRQPEDEFRQAAAAAIVVLLVFVLVLNATAIFLRNYFEKKRG
ncbi:MAG: phosphate ABC transporter permease PstA [Acidimicrobiales bacterium]